MRRILFVIIATAAAVFSTAVSATPVVGPAFQRALQAADPVVKADIIIRRRPVRRWRRWRRRWR